MNFPRLVYKSESEYRLVCSQDEFKSMHEDGWFASVPEALAGAHESVDDLPPTRKELEAKARELSIKFNGKTTNAELNDAITKALAKE